jgi:hypothetical protein
MSRFRSGLAGRCGLPGRFAEPLRERGTEFAVGGQPIPQLLGVIHRQINTVKKPIDPELDRLGSLAPIDVVGQGDHGLFRHETGLPAKKFGPRKMYVNCGSQLSEQRSVCDATEPVSWHGHVALVSIRFSSSREAAITAAPRAVPADLDPIPRWTLHPGVVILVRGEPRTPRAGAADSGAGVPVAILARGEPRTPPRHSCANSEWPTGCNPRPVHSRKAVLKPTCDRRAGPVAGRVREGAPP